MRAANAGEQQDVCALLPPQCTASQQSLKCAATPESPADCSVLTGPACFGWTSQMPGASCMLLPTGLGSVPSTDMISFTFVAAPCDIAVTPCCARHSSTLQQVPAGLRVPHPDITTVLHLPDMCKPPSCPTERTLRSAPTFALKAHLLPMQTALPCHVMPSTLASAPKLNKGQHGG